MKKGFSLIELIFMIVVISIIASYAVPKLMDTKTNAVVSSIKQDISTITTAVQTYYLTNGKIDKISDAVNLNSSVWKIEDKKLQYIDNGTICVDIEIVSNSLTITINQDSSDVCKKLYQQGISTTTYKLQ